MALKIRTDKKWHQFKYRYEVPAKVLKSEFDYQSEDVSDGYFKYKGAWHHLDEFTATQGYGEDLKDWDGILNYSFSSGLLIKVSRDGEQYKVAYYWTTSDLRSNPSRRRARR